MADTVLQVVELGAPPWPTVDPFLFCVHHLDHYPAGDDRLAPKASLAGRTIGNDFAGIDGWRMYHGDAVPGFPGHPHRGFETVTYVRQGVIDHSDSLGATARFGRGDTQWLTAGAGIVHSEMFPLLDPDGPNPLELFQIWLNLPAADKMAEPHFSMLWSEDTPRLLLLHDRTADADGDGDASGGLSELTVIAGAVEGLAPAAPPPHSWASRPDSDVAIWHLSLAAGARWTMPAAASAETVRTIYVFDGTALAIDGEEVAAGHAAVVRTDRAAEVTAEAPVEALVLQGRPIGEPVAQYGPFVLNDRAGIEQAFDDYQRTRFGGWPWPTDGPVHDRTETRFARRPDGTIERPQPAG
jgi:hypothetical protein